MVEYEVHGHVAVFTLNRPEARNAVNGDVANAMTAHLETFEADPEVWVGVLTANTTGHKKPVFCAGADLKVISEGRPGDLATKKGGFGVSQPSLERSRSLLQSMVWRPQADVKSLWLPT